MTLDVYQPNLFTGKVVLTTGGGSGICKGMTEALMRHGADAVICGRKFDRLQEAAKELATKTGKRCVPVQVDVRSFEQIQKAFEVAKSTFGRVDIVIAGAAGNFLASAERLSANAFKTVVEIDLLGTFHTAKAALPYLKETKGQLINLGVTFHYTGTPLQAHASSAKAGVDALTKTLAVEWGSQYGIRVNCIAPGPIDGTPGLDRLNPSLIGNGKAEGSIIPLERLGSIHDIEHATLFITTATFVTGIILVVDGGAWMTMSGYYPKHLWAGKL
ncbi:2,4-dienoyl-CoA reductase [Cladochytrium replicatum]|nr:2,4-dienoyl-CoA reductase [Cladochytrium replicatum]